PTELGPSVVPLCGPPPCASADVPSEESVPVSSLTWADSLLETSILVSPPKDSLLGCGALNDDSRAGDAASGALVSFLSTVASMLRSNNQLQPLNVVVRPISRQGRVRFFFNFDSFGTIDQTSPTQRSSHAPYPT